MMSVWYDSVIKDLVLFAKKGIKDTRRKKPSEIIKFTMSTIVPIGALVVSLVALASGSIKYVVTATQNGKPVEVDISVNIYVLSALVFLFALSTSLCIFSLYWRDATFRQLRKLINKIRYQRNRKSRYLISLRSQYDHVLRQAALVRAQAVEDPINYNFTKMHLHYDISEHGDASVRMNVAIQANQHSVTNWLLFIDASPNGEKLLLATEINLSVECGGDSKCAIIPIRDGLERKDFLIFFLPEIAPRQSREVTLRYHWPKMFFGLNSMSPGVRTGSEEVYWRYAGRTRNKTCDFLLEMDISTRLGQISAELTGAKPKSGELSIRSDINTTKVVYKIADMPCASDEYKLNLTSK